MDTNTVILAFAVMFGMITGVISDGMLSIHFNHFTNPQGLGANGHCCDGRAFFCLSPCDHYFILCLDHPDGNPHDYVNCPLGRFVTNKIDEMDSIRFGATIGGINNPMLVPIRHWRNGFLLKVEVWDSDIGVTAGEYVDSLRKKVLIPMAKKASLAETKTVLLSTRTSLTIEVKAFCNPNYYGPQCTIKCMNQDDANGHYLCDEETGERKCLPGWSGDSCTDAINECASSPCQNGGTCIDDHNRFHCLCPTGTAGDQCQVDIDECRSRPCLNGGSCIDLIGEFNCSCAPGYIGDTCHLPDPCSFGPCKNNGTCVNEGDFEYACDCHTGFTGENCEKSLDSNRVKTSINVDKDHDSLGVPVLLAGHLKHEDEINMKHWLISAVLKSAAIKRDCFVAIVTLSQCKGENGDPVTNALLKVTYDVHKLDNKTVEKSKDFVVHKIDENFPYEKFDGDDCMIAQIAALVVGESWIAQNWFIPVGIGIVLVAIIVIILILFVKRLRRKEAFDRAAVGYECVETSSSAATTPRNSTSSAPEYDVTHAFSNAIYLRSDKPLRNGGIVHLPEMSAEEEHALRTECTYDDYQEENFYHTID
ncbi:uncharacterized protein LOC141908184 [Tubulanus polymorphus]|uniref:uncharacterized protein LOC141908184 n=1 Tax=Tubulanus polymorphus TaxID=672921 RepID=UPI003DA2ECF5